MLLEILIWFICGYIILSFVEWSIHKYHMHQKGWLNYIQPYLFTHHQLIHHPNYRSNFSIPINPKDADIGVYMPLKQNTILGLIIFIPFGIFVSLPGAITLFSIIIVHHLMWNFLHGNMHDVKACEKWSQWRFFRFFKNYHYNHHKYPNSNFNIIAIGADFIMKTYRSS